MIERFRWQAVRVVVGSLAVIAAGCGSESGLSPAGPSPGFSAGTIEIAPAGAIVGTSVTLRSLLASDPSGSSLSYDWDFGDGSTAAGEATTHVYATAGDFFAKVTVSNSEGGSTHGLPEHPGEEPHRPMVGRRRPGVDHPGRSRPPGDVSGRFAPGHRRGKNQRDGYGHLHRYEPGPRPSHVHRNGGPGGRDPRGRRERARRRQQALDARPQLGRGALRRSPEEALSVRRPGSSPR